MFLMASILLIVSTVFHSSVAVIIRHLKSVPVASLNSSREIVLVIISYLFILIGDIQIYAPTLTDKLKLLLFSKQYSESMILVFAGIKIILKCRLLCDSTSDSVNIGSET